jgi:ABC-2 type transport system permease protein
MMTIWTLYRREMGSIFVSPVAYLVMAACSLIQGFSFALHLDHLNAQQETRISALQANLGFFFWLLLLGQIPLLTMRTFSEEYKMGTIEMLLTAPVREWELVLAKYFGVLTFFLLLWTPVIINLLFLYAFSGDHVPVPWPQTGLCYLMLLLIGMFYLAIGVLMSSMTRNQIVAAVLAFVVVLSLFLLSLLPLSPWFGGDREFQLWLMNFSTLQHMWNFSNGIFDSRPVVLYLSLTLYVLFVNERLLVARRHTS